MIFICEHCDSVFDAEDMGIYVEPHGEETGVCPYCGSPDMERGEYCEACGEAHLPDDLCDGWCKDCIAEYNNDIETCYQVAEKDKQVVKINGLLATLYEPAAIEEILYKHLIEKAKEEDIDCSEYINQDASWFVENVKRLD